MDKKTIWFGQAFCTVEKNRSEYASGHRSALFVFCCCAPSLIDCVAMIAEESAENNLCLRGFEYIMQKDYMDRELSPYELQLENQVHIYPTQFKNVHFALPDT